MKEHDPKWFRRVLTIWMVAFTILVFYGLNQSRIASHNNTERIQDIQQSRVQSCERNYKTLREVFIPFFPPKAGRTPEQERNIKRFLKLTNPHKCVAQTRP